jgi:hypothetical protein
MKQLDPHYIRKIGLSGLIPYVLLSLACWIVHPDWMDYFISGQLSFGIALLSLMGGIHWGVVFMSPEKEVEDKKRLLLWGVLPGAIAWFSLINTGLGFLIQMLAFIFSYHVDKKLYAMWGVPEWIIQERYRLTCIMVGAQVLTFLAANIR